MTKAEEILEMGRLWLDLALVDFRLSFLPLRMNRSWLFPRRTDMKGAPEPAIAERAQAYARLIRRLAPYRLRKGSPCLALALALRRRLRRLGIEADIVYGVRTGAPSGGKGRVDAHAWLEAGGMRIDPLGTGSGFSPFKKGGQAR